MSQAKGLMFHTQQESDGILFVLHITCHIGMFTFTNQTSAFISGPRTSKGCSHDFQAVFQTSSDTEVESDKLHWLYINAQLKCITLSFINLKTDSSQMKYY